MGLGFNVDFDVVESFGDSVAVGMSVFPIASMDLVAGGDITGDVAGGDITGDVAVIVHPSYINSSIAISPCGGLFISPPFIASNITLSVFCGRFKVSENCH